MTGQLTVDERRRPRARAEDARAKLLQGTPVEERRLQLAGISTAVLEGGDGSPIVLLHGPAGNAAHWFRVIPGLLATHRVVAPDLPGQGRSTIDGGALDADRMIGWLGELIEQTCAAPPCVVGYALGGAVAARFAGRHTDRIGRLVLVDSLGLVPFEPAPEFGRALQTFLAAPSRETHDQLWRQCALDLDTLRRGMADRWAPFEEYNLDRIRAPGVMAALGALMEQFGGPAISPADLERIAAPTTLIWGRHDLATPVRVAEEASARYGWPLHVIERCADDPPIEQPDAFMAALRTALDA